MDSTGMYTLFLWALAVFYTRKRKLYALCFVAVEILRDKGLALYDIYVSASIQSHVNGV
jgi:hypothetical protein